VQFKRGHVLSASDLNNLAAKVFMVLRGDGETINVKRVGNKVIIEKVNRLPIKHT
jgi:hypothetical protein